MKRNETDCHLHSKIKKITHKNIMQNNEHNEIINMNERELLRCIYYLKAKSHIWIVVTTRPIII